METFSVLLAFCAGNSPVRGEFPSQRPVTRSFDVFFDLCLNKHVSKQSWGWWSETLSSSLWRQCNVHLITYVFLEVLIGVEFFMCQWHLSSLQWHHIEHNGISNHWHFHSLFNCWFRHRSKKTSKLRVTGLLWGIHQWPVIFLHKRPVKRKMFPFDDAIMIFLISSHHWKQWLTKFTVP